MKEVRVLVCYKVLDRGKDCFVWGHVFAYVSEFTEAGLNAVRDYVLRSKFDDGETLAEDFVFTSVTKLD